MLNIAHTCTPILTMYAGQVEDVVMQYYVLRGSTGVLLIENVVTAYSEDKCSQHESSLDHLFLNFYVSTCS